MKTQYDIIITAESEVDCQDALSLIKKLLHTFKEGIIWKDERFALNVKVNQMLSQDK